MRRPSGPAKKSRQTGSRPGADGQKVLSAPPSEACREGEEDDRVAARKASLKEVEQRKRRQGDRWKARTCDVLDKYALPSDFSAWTSRPSFRGRGLPASERVRALVNVGWGKRLLSSGGKSEVEASRGWYCDISQAVEREPFGPLGTLCQSSYKYSYRHDFVLTGADHLSVLGFPREVVAQGRRLLSDGDLRSLAGEAFHMPCVAAILFGYYMNPLAPWWRQPAGNGPSK